MMLEGVEGGVLLLLAVVTWPLSRRFLAQLGTTPAEREREWPGDSLVPRVDACATRAVAVRAPASRVWPWLVQFGFGRGGFYSYELLERLGGIEVRNVERIRPELQALEVGDELVLYPERASLHVALLAPGEHLCTRTWKDERELAERDPAIIGSFSLYLVSTGDASCRLLIRTCKSSRRPRRRGARWVAAMLEDPLDLVMEQRMLRTLRRLAERTR